MSNQAVGSVYQIIIDEVINSSRVDFEESGIDEIALEELRQGWQQKLSQLDVARFPWDPKPEQTPAVPVAAPPAPAPTHTQAQFSPPLSLPGAGGAASGTNGVDAGGVKNEAGLPIKQEPGAQAGGGMPPYPNYNGMDNKNFGNMDNKNNVAANRAQQQLKAQYGNKAIGSINAIQDRIVQQPVRNTQVPLPQQPQHPSQQQQQMLYRQQMAAQTQQQQQQQGQQPVPAGAPAPQNQNGQTDGAGDDDDDDDDDEDFEGVLLQRGAGGNVNELGRVEIDRMLHDRIAAKAKSMEGGGLMLPLKEATRHTAAGPSGSRSRGRKGVAAHDGGDDDDEEPDEVDEDAINSDLDDPDEDRDDDEVDDEGLGHIMLCMYDKVQRVKNKWKCTLKDGVLTVNGKEYVFHKANGEYEW